MVQQYCSPSHSVTHLAGGRDATPLGTLLHNTNRLELLQDSTGDGTAADGVMEAADTVVLGTAVVLAEGTHTHVPGDVQLACHGRRADVEPVGVVRGELLEGSSLHNVNPGGHLHLALLVVGAEWDEAGGTGVREKVSQSSKLMKEARGSFK